MPRLPVSGIDVVLRPPNGSDALMLLESPEPPVPLALALLHRVAHPADGTDGATATWAMLAITDFELLLASLRMLSLGPVIPCGLACPHCAERVELAISLPDYLAPIRPFRPRHVSPMPGRPGWFRLGEAAFRVPTAGDQAAALAGGGAALLAQRCLEPDNLTVAARARAERAMAAMAPEISRPVTGVCPACRNALRAFLHLPTLVIAELRRAAFHVPGEVHLIAAAYGWSEAAILALPAPRRQDYASRIRRQAA